MTTPSLSRGGGCATQTPHGIACKFAQSCEVSKMHDHVLLSTFPNIFSKFLLVLPLMRGFPLLFGVKNSFFYIESEF